MKRYAIFSTMLGVVLSVALFAAFSPVALAQDNALVIDAEEYIDMEASDCGIQAAIDAAFELGGGTVNIPEGEYPLRRGLLLKDNVKLAGAGMDETILIPAREITRMDPVAGPDDDGWFRFEALPDDLEVGSGLILWRGFPTGHVGYLRPAWVTEVDRERNAIKLEAPYGMPANIVVGFGGVAALAEDIAEGDSEIELRSASLFKPGDELTLGTPGNDSSKEHLFVKEVRGNTVVLESPAKKDFAAFPDDEKEFGSALSTPIYAVFPLIHAWTASNFAITDLTIKGRGWEEIHPANTRFTLGGMHLYNSRDSLVERVAVREWHTDGFSLQGGDNLSVLKCEATDNNGHGFHPGTSLANSLFEENLSERNGNGLYFCWHNRGHVMRNNRFVRNRGGGMTGLGNPGERNNIIEDNLIAENGAMGIQINGGGRTNNIIRNNIIENNSQNEPGKHPGIHLNAAVEDAREYIIEENIVRDTQEDPTQFVGVKEEHGVRRDNVVYADENVIRNNKYSGHREADVIVVGLKTVVEEDDEAVVVDNRHDPAADEGD